MRNFSILASSGALDLMLFGAEGLVAGLTGLECTGLP